MNSVTPKSYLTEIYKTTYKKIGDSKMDRLFLVRTAYGSGRLNVLNLRDYIRH